MRPRSVGALDRLSAALAVGTALWALLLLSAFPEVDGLARGHGGSVLGLELATLPAHVAPLAGDAAEPARRAFDRGHALDMVFPLFYGGLLAALLWRGRGPTSALGRVAAVLTVPADVRENLVLWDLTAELDAGGDGTVALAALPLATWTKWSCLAAALAATGVQEARVHELLGGTALLAAGAIVTLGLTGAPLVAQVMNASLVVFYAAAVVTTVRAVTTPTR
ncbi:MAG: hypothetical protein KC656_03200 [Myxococcales bacterium]|nr:hypothetical protein [Myxococcales bacterium]MCB9672386.1 hypothetical protein [Alphaproteobacteria bacterium]